MKKKTFNQKKNIPDNEKSKPVIVLTPLKKRLFILITALLPLLILVLLEISLRVFNYGEDLPLFVSTPDEASKFNGININVAKRYFSKLNNAPTPRKDLFLKVKPENGYRIFVLGESTAAGYPYGNNVTFSRILNRRLSDIFPDRHIEVINTAMTAINSYTLLDFMDEILLQKPDAILIYTGHNEFYGALGVSSMESLGKHRWMVKTLLKLQKLKLYMLIQNAIKGTMELFSSAPSDSDHGNASATLMERIVKDKIIPINSSDYNLGKEQFRENLIEIIRKARNAGVKVIISELVCNLHDNPPFESIEDGSSPSALKIYNKALELERQGKISEAKTAFYKAKDLDALRFRAPEEFNSIMHEIAAEFKIPIVPMKSYFESYSPNGIIGNNLMHEHLHPNYDGYFLMADAFYNTIKETGIIDSEWPGQDTLSMLHYRNNWGYTSLDSMYAYFSIMQLKGGWPFKKGNEINNTLLNYRPATRIDSLAKKILTQDGITLEMGHIELSQYYERKGELELALKECMALIYTVPYLDLFYEPAVKLLVQMGKYDKALELLEQLSKYQETIFGYKWTGQIYLLKNETEKGISFLKKAVDMGGQDPALIYNLGRACYSISLFDQGDLYLNKLKTLSANPAYIQNLESFRKYSFENLNTTK